MARWHSIASLVLLGALGCGEDTPLDGGSVSLCSSESDPVAFTADPGIGFTAEQVSAFLDDHPTLEITWEWSRIGDLDDTVVTLQSAPTGSDASFRPADPDPDAHPSCTDDLLAYEADASVSIAGVVSATGLTGRVSATALDASGIHLGLDGDAALDPALDAPLATFLDEDDGPGWTLDHVYVELTAPDGGDAAGMLYVGAYVIHADGSESDHSVLRGAWTYAAR